MPTFSRSVCHTIAAKSLFRRTAILSRTQEGRFAIISSTGIDQDVPETLNDWAASLSDSLPSPSASFPNPRHLLPAGIDIGDEVARSSPRATMAESSSFPSAAPAAAASWVPSSSAPTDRMLNVRRRLVNGALRPMESLALKLGRAIENAALADRLLRAEKLAGIGLLASGVAHTLNNPLTAVMGFAELIAETSGQARVQEDAETIVREAQRMRDTVQSLLELARPSIHRDEIFDLSTATSPPSTFTPTERK